MRISLSLLICCAVNAVLGQMRSSIVDVGWGTRNYKKTLKAAVSEEENLTTHHQSLNASKLSAAQKVATEQDNSRAADFPPLYRV